MSEFIYVSLSQDNLAFSELDANHTAETARECNPWFSWNDVRLLDRFFPVPKSESNSIREVPIISTQRSSLSD